MKKSLISLSIAGTVLLTGCGGGEPETSTRAMSSSLDRAAEETADEPRRRAQAATFADASAAERHAIRLHQAFHGTAPGHAKFQQLVTQINSSGASAAAASLAAEFGSLSDAALALRVLNNLKVTPATVATRSSYDTLLSAVEQIFAAYGPAARGQIILNAATLLAGLESDVTFGNSAKSFTGQTTANYTHSSNPANTVAQVVAVTPGGNTTAVAGSAAECFNPVWSTPGTRAEFSTVLSGQASGTSRNTLTVIGGQTFNGTANLLEVRVDSSMRFTAPAEFAIDNLSIQVRSFVSLDSTLRRIHGEVIRGSFRDPDDGQLIDESASTTYTPALNDGRYGLLPGQSRIAAAAANTTFTSNVEPIPPVAGNLTTTTTYHGQEIVRVPAGTFTACRFSITTAGLTRTEWISKGSGIPIRSTGRLAPIGLVVTDELANLPIVNGQVLGGS